MYGKTYAINTETNTFAGGLGSDLEGVMLEPNNGTVDSGANSGVLNPDSQRAQDYANRYYG